MSFLNYNYSFICTTDTGLSQHFQGFKALCFSNGFSNKRAKNVQSYTPAMQKYRYYAQVQRNKRFYYCSNCT